MSYQYFRCQISIAPLSRIKEIELKPVIKSFKILFLIKTIVFYHATDQLGYNSKLFMINSLLNISYRSHYLIAYIIWSFVWVGFNVFIICFYLSVGDLQAEEDLLSFGTGSFSWWLINTPGCQPHYNTTVSPGIVFRMI